MDDLLVDLRDAARRLKTDEAAPRAPAPRTRRQWTAAAGGAALGLLAAALIAARSRAPVIAPLPIAEPGVRVRALTREGLNERPSLSAAGDRVVYSSDRNGSDDLYLHEVTTGERRRLTDDPGDELQPSFSPAGDRIAYLTGRGQLRVMAAGGGAGETLAEGATDRPAWSHDGRRIVYRGGTELFSVEAPGDPAKLETGGLPVLSTPAWSPDDNWLAFASVQSSAYVLVRVPSRGGAPQVIGRDAQALGGTLQWTGDGRWLVGNSGPPRDPSDQIWALPTGGSRGAGEPVRLLAGGPAFHQNPSLSRDARRAAFEVVELHTNVARLPADANGPREAELLPGTVRLTGSAIGPAGRELIVTTDRLGMINLWRMSAADGSAEPVGDSDVGREYPAWSPDGGRLAFSQIAAGTRRLAVIEASGGTAVPLSEPEYFVYQSAWSPDGRQVAFTTGGTGGSLRAIAATGGASRELARFAGRVRRPSWSPDGSWIAAAGQAADGSWSLIAVPSAGGPARTLLADARAPLWLRDGRIVFLRASHRETFDLWSLAVDAQGQAQGNPSPLTRLPRGRTAEADQGVTTDGRFLYFTLFDRSRTNVWLAEAP
jgi:Tol biopolymer transport system component